MKYLTIILALFFLSSCTKTIYNHGQIMDDVVKNADKNSIIEKMGLPTQKREAEGVEEWIYDLGSQTRIVNYGNSRTNASVNAGNGYAYGNANTNSIGVSTFSQFQRYVKFTFDRNGKIIRWDTQGVDYSQKKVAVGKTIVFSTLYLGICVALGYLMAF